MFHVVRNNAKHLLVASLAFGACAPAPTLSQTMAMTNEQREAYTQVCAETDASKTPANIDAINTYAARANLSSERRSDLINVCLVYIDGWNHGRKSLTPSAESVRGYKEVCSSEVKAAMSGDSAWITRYIEQSSLNEVDKVSLLLYCRSFRDGALFAAKMARDIISGNQ